MSDFTQPICRHCWEGRNPYRTPHHLTVAESERCCYCGEPTRHGIYVRVDPASVPYPTIAA